MFRPDLTDAKAVAACQIKRLCGLVPCSRAEVDFGEVGFEVPEDPKFRVEFITAGGRRFGHTFSLNAPQM